MSFIKSALSISFFDIPVYSSFSTLDTNYFLHGMGNDVGYNVFRASGIYTISQYMGNWYTVSPGGLDVYPLYQTYNGEACFGTNWYLFYTGTPYGWVIKGDMLPCYEVWNSVAGHYYGDEFWSTGSVSTTILPSEGGAATTFKARGYQRGDTEGAYQGTDKTLAFKFVRWQSSVLYGEYSPLGGASGSKFVGVPEWTSTYGDTLDKSVNVSASNTTPYQSSSGYYTYFSVIAENPYPVNNIYYSTVYSKWLIGIYNSALGWYEGSEPSKTEDVTFTFTVPEGSEVTGTNRTISFSTYVKGIETYNMYMCNVGAFLP